MNFRGRGLSREGPLFFILIVYRYKMVHNIIKRSNTIVIDSHRGDDLTGSVYRRYEFPLYTYSFYVVSDQNIVISGEHDIDFIGDINSLYYDGEALDAADIITTFITGRVI